MLAQLFERGLKYANQLSVGSRFGELLGPLYASLLVFVVRFYLLRSRKLCPASIAEGIR